MNPGMDASRRYRQQGYRESAGKKAKPARPSGAEPSPAPRMLGKRAVSRCAECGTLLTVLTEPLGQCPRCKLELHSCKQCTHFDPARRFECTQPIPERVPDKGALNDCAYFSLRVIVERDASGGSMRPEDARRAFDKLFNR